MDNILKDDSQKEKYVSKTFSEEGHKTIKAYCCSLIRLYLDSPQYPYKQMGILGIPMMKVSQVIPTKEAHFERIVVLAQLLGINEFKIKLENGTDLIYNIGGL